MIFFKFFNGLYPVNFEILLESHLLNFTSLTKLFDLTIFLFIFKILLKISVNLMILVESSDPTLNV